MSEVVKPPRRDEKAAYYLANRAAILDRRAAYRAEHPGIRTIWDRTYRATHPEQVRVQQTRWRKANPDRGRAAVMLWQRANPQAHAREEHNRRARKRNAEGSYTLVDWQAKFAEYGGLCAYCLTAPATTADHAVPLARGGSNGIENLIPACKSCNCRKGTNTAGEFTLQGAPR